MNWLSTRIMSLVFGKSNTKKKHASTTKHNKSHTTSHTTAHTKQEKVSGKKTKPSIYDIENRISVLVFNDHHDARFMERDTQGHHATHLDINPMSNADLDYITKIKKSLKTAVDIVVYSDADAPKHNSYEDIKDVIYGLITKSKVMCKDINSNYIGDTFEEVDAVYVLGSPRVGSKNILPSGNIYGFALVNFDEYKNELYIEMICSHSDIKYAGESMIKHLSEICKKLDISAIRLKSVEKAVSFYEKYGFEKINKSCNDMCVMVKLISSGGGSPPTMKTNKTRTQRKTKNSRHTKKVYTRSH
jgi:hypothetical protein